VDNIPWLDDVIASLGTHEIAGPVSNEKILEYFAAVGHPECRSEEIPWCAARTGAALKAAGYPIPPKEVCLMARSYCTYGVACEPKRGAIVVFPRGNSTWQGHVGVVVEVIGSDVKYVAGNQSDQVGYGTAPIAQALAFRWPVKPTVPDLRKAGSTEIKQGDRVQNVGTLMTFLTAIVAAIKELLDPITAVPKLGSPVEAFDWWKATIQGAQNVAQVVLQNPWVAGVVVGGLVLCWVGHTIKKARVAKAQSGVPLSTQVA
jgi:uncharacterized protein (TIGR02594 family)